MFMLDGYTEDTETDERFRFLSNEYNLNMITHLIEKAHNIQLSPASIVIDENDDILAMDYFDNRTFNNHVTVANVNSQELSFFRSVYRHSISQEKINISYKPKYFSEYYERIIAVYSNFYEDVEIVWITNGKIENNTNNDVMPTYNIQDNILKIIGINPRYSVFKDIPYFIQMNEINFNNKSGSDNFLDLFFERINQHVIPKNVDIELHRLTDIDTLNEQLVLISMWII
jgi:hypothetical protein